MKYCLSLKSIIILVIGFAAAKCAAQITPDYTKLIFKESTNLRPIEIIADANYEMYVMGIIGYDSVLVYKYASDGTLIWKKNFKGSNGTMTMKNNVLAAAVTEFSSNPAVRTAVIRRLDKSTGNTITIASYTNTFINNEIGGNTNLEVLTIGSTGIYMGCTEKAGAPGSLRFDFKLVKLGFTGYASWQKTYVHGYGNGLVVGASMDDAENIYLAGYGYNGNYAVFTMKYSGNTGSQLWVNSYFDANIKKITTDASGNPIICGIEKIPLGGWKGFLKKFNSAGSLQWVKYVTPSNPADYSVVSEVITDANNNVITRSHHKTSGLFRQLISKYTPGGALVWSSFYYPSTTPDSVDNYGSNLALGTGNSVYLTGTSNTNSYIAKFNGSGTFLWDNFYETSPDVSTTGERIIVKTNLLRGSSKIFFAATYSTPYVSSLILLRKYNESIISSKPLAELTDPEIPASFSLSQNYPNPFNPSTKIEFTLPISGDVKLAVYDALGSEVAVLVNGFTNAGRYKTEFNASALSSGTYFCKIETEGFTDTKKMILVK